MLACFGLGSRRLRMSFGLFHARRLMELLASREQGAMLLGIKNFSPRLCNIVDAYCFSALLETPLSRLGAMA
jgi:hypothetical protein